jgi:hypothetical protein
MILEFSDEADQDASKKFQRWRRAHPEGFFINRKSRTAYLLHSTLCPHLGWGADASESPTRKRKTCSRSIAELEAWALAQNLPIRRCQDCAPAESSDDYIAYHSSEVMSREYRPTAERFHFYSQKPEGFLRKAIGCRVWVVAGTRNGSRTIYRLAGMFTLSKVRRENDGFGVLGDGICINPPVDITALPWFAELFREQNRFSYGFNRIRSAGVVGAMRSLLEQSNSEPVLQPDEIASASQFFEGATRQVSVNRYERNRFARHQCIQHYGCRCSVCGFDFEVAYGKFGAGFIHIHHLKALSEIGQEYEIDPVADLRPVCPNCHAMIHRTSEMMTIEQLRGVIQRHINSAGKTI